MGFSSNGMTSIRNNRSLQRRTKSYFRKKGPSTLPTDYHNKNDQSPSYSVLKDRMETQEVRIFLVFGLLCVGIGLLVTLWIL